MKVLLVEDDPNKSRQIEEFLMDALPDISVTVRRSYSSGLRETRIGNPDLVLLDMSLPNFDSDANSEGGRFRSYGGRDILQQLARRHLATKVIVVTQFETFSTERESVSLADLSSRLREDFPQNFLDTIYYNASQDDWKKRLLRMIQDLWRGTLDA